MPSLWSALRRGDAQQSPQFWDPISGRDLIELLRDADVDWDAVSSRAVACPHEVSNFRSNIKGQTALFIAIERRAPPLVIKTLLAALPAAAKEAHQHTGLTALHFAVALRSDYESILHILKAWPVAASQRMSDGSVPLHFARDGPTAKMLIEACPSSVEMKNNASYLPLHRVSYATNASAEVLRVLIDEGRRRNVGGINGGGGVFLKARNGFTPLQAACDVIDKVEPASNWAAALSPPAEKKWEKLVVILRSASMASFEMRRAGKERNDTYTDDDFRVLHTVIELGCPALIIQYALRTNPSQSIELDRWGRSPLSIAAARRDTPDEVIEMLLKPPYGCIDNARKADKSGRLPLHHAAGCKRGYDKGMEAILKAAPDSLEIRDGVTNLYPFMLAAVEDRETGSIDTVYRLLRESPWLIRPTSGHRNTKPQGLHEWKVTPQVLTWLLLPVAVAVILHFTFFS